MQIFPTLMFGHVADAASARSCGTLVTALKPILPGRSFSGVDLPETETVLSLLLGQTSLTRTFLTFDRFVATGVFDPKPPLTVLVIAAAQLARSRL